MKSNKILSAICGLLLLTGCIITVSHKQNLFPDEVSSFELSNYPVELYRWGSDTLYHPAQGDNLYDYVHYNNPSAEWDKVLSVHSGHRFDYANVWENQKKDVHPPLYYSLLHTICSFTPEKYSVWQGCSINILFLLLTLWVLQSLTYELTENRWMSILTIAFFALSPAIYNVSAWIRMYAVAMFEITLLCLLIVRYLKADNLHWEQMLTICLTTLIGALTHYYVILFTILLTATYCVIDLLRGQYKKILCLIGTMVTAALAAVAIFPAMLTHALGSGVHGQNAKANLIDLSVFRHRMHLYFSWIDHDIFGFTLPLLVALLVLALVVVLIRQHSLRKTPWGKVSWAQWSLIAIPALGYFIVVGATSSYIADRYMYPIYALIILCVVMLTALLASPIPNQRLRKVILPTLLVGMTISSYAQFYWSNLGILPKQATATLQQYRDADCLFVHNGKCFIYSSTSQTQNLGSLTICPQDETDSCLSIAQRLDKPFFLITGEMADTNMVFNTFSEYNIDRICQIGWSITYLVNEK